MVRAKTSAKTSTKAKTPAKTTARKTTSAEDDYSSMKVTELKQLLKDRNLSTAGTKAELVTRLQTPKGSEKGKTVKKTKESDDESEEKPAKKTRGRKPAKAKASKPSKVESESESEEKPKKKATKGKKVVKVESESESESESEEKPKKKATKGKKVVKVESESESEEKPKKKTTKGKKVVKVESESESESESEKPKKKTAKGKKVESESEPESEGEDSEIVQEELTLPPNVEIPDVTYNVSAQDLFLAVFRANELSSDQREFFAMLTTNLSNFEGGASPKAPSKALPKKEKAKKTPPKEKEEASVEESKDEEKDEEEKDEEEDRQPFEVEYDENLNVYVDKKTHTWVFDSRPQPPLASGEPDEANPVFAKVQDGSIVPLNNRDLKVLDVMRIKNKGVLAEEQVAQIVSAQNDEGAADGTDVEEPEKEDVVDNVEDEEMQVFEIDEDTFMKFIKAQRSGNILGADYTAIAEEAGIEESQAEFIMVNLDKLNAKYPQAAAKAVTKKKRIVK